MGRVNRFKAMLGKDETWVEYGKWLELQRAATSLTQEQVAKRLGISRRQWIRYTQGAPVPYKRIKKLIKVLGLNDKKAYLRAGYEMPRNLKVWVDSRLQHIRDAVLGGNMAGALMHLFDFYYESVERKKKYRRVSPGTAASDFMNAAALIDRMPAWLRDEFLVYLWEVRKGGKKYVFTETSTRQEKIRKMIRRDLPRIMMLKGRIPIEVYRESKKGKEV